MMRIFGGFIFLMLRHYTKKFRTHAEQVTLLKERGLLVYDEAKAVEALKTVNYYRFTGYAIPFMSNRERFTPGTSFSDVMEVCLYDRKMRDKFFEAIEILELDFRARFAYRFSERHGPLGYRDCQFFSSFKDHAETLRKVSNEIVASKEICIKHFNDEYYAGEIPIWTIVEILSFGTLARCYNNLLPLEQNSISSEYGFRGDMFGSYIKHVSVLRNFCAHHMRMYDKRFFGYKPLHEWRQLHLLCPDTRFFFPQCLLVYRLLKSVNTSVFNREEWKRDLIQLLHQAPKFESVNITSIMGVPKDVDTSKLWI